MDKILKKIDELISDAERFINKYPKNDRYKTQKRTLETVKQIILSEQKEPIGNTEQLTIGDKIRESNGKTANLLHELADCKKCPVIDGCTANNDYACYGRLFDYLNQPYTE